MDFGDWLLDFDTKFRRIRASSGPTDRTVHQPGLKALDGIPPQSAQGPTDRPVDS